MEKTQGQLIVKAKGGLGNRLLCAITGILYAECTGRNAIIDWRDGIYDEEGENAFSKLFECQNTYPTSSIEESSGPIPLIWQNNLEKSIGNMMTEFSPTSHKSRFIHRKYSIRTDRTYPNKTTLIFWNYIDRINQLKKTLKKLNHPYSSLKKEEIINRTLKERLTPKRDILEKIEQFQSAHFEENTIGVHLRYSDRKIPLSKYVNPIEKALKANPKANFFLATDSKEAEKWFIQKYPNTIFYQKRLPSNGLAMHDPTLSHNKSLAAEEAIIDIYLLSKCKTLIYPSNSTFSYLSHCLSIENKTTHHDTMRHNIPHAINKILREAIA